MTSTAKMVAMDVDADLTCTSPPHRVFETIADLGTYPDWLDIVTRAEPVPAGPDDDGAPAWSVDLRGQVGPLRRTKRLRMVRTRVDQDHHVRFERREVDGRQHSPWVLSATVEPVGSGTGLPGASGTGLPGASGTVLTMRMHYGGRLWVPVLDRLLAQEIEHSRTRLAVLLGETAAP